MILNDGYYSGLAIDLWQEVAADQGWKYQYKRYDLEGLLNAVSADQVDVGLGTITATAEREKRMDFFHSLTSSGLSVAVRSQTNRRMAGCRTGAVFHRLPQGDRHLGAAVADRRHADMVV